MPDYFQIEAVVFNLCLLAVSVAALASILFGRTGGD